MVSVTITLDGETKTKMDRFSWINWSELSRLHLMEDAKRQKSVARLKELLKNSKLTEADADELSEKIKKSMHKRLVDEGLV